MASVKAWWRGLGANGSRTGRHPVQQEMTSRPSVVNAAAASFLAAEPAFRDVALGERILLDCDKILGFEHPDTVAVATGLAATHQAAGRPDKASPLYSAALDVRTRTLGAEHPDTRRVAAALAESQAKPVTVQRPDVPVPIAGGRAVFD